MSRDKPTYRCFHCGEIVGTGCRPLKDHFGIPQKLTKAGWYFVENNSGDRWISYCDPRSQYFDPFFGYSENDGIVVAGPISWPGSNKKSNGQVI